MEDMMSKIQGMLSDEESLKQIKDLADMIISSNDSSDESGEHMDGGGNNEPFSSDENDSEGSSDSLGFDIGMLLKLVGLFNSAPEGDKNTQLLIALRPLLKEEKQERVDKAVKMMKLFAVWTVVKESGMLKDIF